MGCFSPPLTCRQHELPPRKSRAVSVQAHDRRRDDEGPGRWPGFGCRDAAGRQGLYPGCTGLPLRGEQQEQREYQEEGLRHHQKPPSQQGERVQNDDCSSPVICALFMHFVRVLICVLWMFAFKCVYTSHRFAYGSFNDLVAFVGVTLLTDNVCDIAFVTHTEATCRMPKLIKVSLSEVMVMYCRKCCKTHTHTQQHFYIRALLF